MSHLFISLLLSLLFYSILSYQILSYQILSYPILSYIDSSTPTISLINFFNTDHFPHSPSPPSSAFTVPPHFIPHFTPGYFPPPSPTLLPISSVSVTSQAPLHRLLVRSPFLFTSSHILLSVTFLSLTPDTLLPLSSIYLTQLTSHTPLLHLIVPSPFLFTSSHILLAATFLNLPRYFYLYYQFPKLSSLPILPFTAS